MTDKALLLLLIIAPGPIFIGFLTMPRWYFRSVYRHDLWDLRDRIVDDIIEERLPGSHPAVRQLARRAENTARHCKQMSIADYFVFRRIFDGDAHVSARMRTAARTKDVHGLTPAQKQLVELYRERMITLVSGTMILGSWLGFASVLWIATLELVGRLTLVIRARRMPADLFANISAVWDRAVETARASTSFGRRSSEFARKSMALGGID